MSSNEDDMTNATDGASLLDEPQDTNSNDAQRKSSIISQIEYVFLEIAKLIGNGRFPVLRALNKITPCYSSVNKIVNPSSVQKRSDIKFCKRKGRKKLSLMMFTLSKIMQILTLDSQLTRRALYYRHQKIYETPNMVAQMSKFISINLGVPEWELGLTSTGKGLIAGDLKIIFSDETIECLEDSGTTVPQNIYKATQFETKAKFILIVEKDSVFQYLLTNNFVGRFSQCLLVTGKGFPDLSTRFLLHILVEKLSIPGFILVDGDPFGVEIMLTYCFGAIGQAHMNHRLAVPSATWIGVLPSDIQKLRLNTKEFTNTDLRRASLFLSRPCIQQSSLLHKELELFLRNKEKIEIEDIAKISPNYLTEVYIPTKLQSKGFACST